MTSQSIVSYGRAYQPGPADDAATAGGVGADVTSTAGVAFTLIQTLRAIYTQSIQTLRFIHILTVHPLTPVFKPSTQLLRCPCPTSSEECSPHRSSRADSGKDRCHCTCGWNAWVFEKKVFKLDKKVQTLMEYPVCRHRVFMVSNLSSRGVNESKRELCACVTRIRLL